MSSRKRKHQQKTCDSTEKQNLKDIRSAIAKGVIEDIKGFRHLIVKDIYYTDSLLVVAKQENHEIFQVAKDCNLDIFNRKIKQKAGIEWLCAARRADCVETVFLIELGANIQGAKSPFDQPLNEARSIEILKILLQNGAK